MATVRLYYGRDNDEMINRIKEAQEAKREISTLEVRETVLDENVIEAIVDLLSKRNVETVQLDDCGAFINKQADRMAKALGKVKNLRLSEPTFLSQFFLDSLLVSATELQNLRIQDHLDSRQIKALASGLKENKSLTTLDLSRSRLDSFSILADGLKENTSLKNLKLRSLGLGDDHVNQILSAVSDHPALTSLDLSFNHCLKLDNLPEFLESQTNIQELLLGYQNVWHATKFDIRKLAKSLKNNSSLKSLSLARNKLNNEDAAILTCALRVNSTLEFLDLRENKINDGGAVAIADAAAQNNSGLKRMILAKNPFGRRGLTALLSAVRINVNLIQVQLPRSNCLLSHQIELYAALNMGGRKIIYQNPTAGLWPLVLERVNRINWKGDMDSFFEECANIYQLDVLYFFLKGPALFEGMISELP